jgi:hypothetical protein
MMQLNLTPDVAQNLSDLLDTLQELHGDSWTLSIHAKDKTVLLSTDENVARKIRSIHSSVS